jgi:beta-glucosidase
MNRILLLLAKVLAFFLILILIIALIYYMVSAHKVKKIYAQLGGEAPTMVENGYSFRDLNKNGRLDVYEDSRQDLGSRVEDLLSQMTVEEKAGIMFVSMIGMTAKGDVFDLPTTDAGFLNNMMSMVFPSSAEMLVSKKLNSFNIIDSYNADVLARYNNNVQKIAERMRLGIPITIATDPRHGSENNPGASVYTPSFSQWPTSLGLAATRDTALVKLFGDVARQEYRAVGLTLALHPMADLATEPRWGRINGTFGEDAQLSAMMTKAYVMGFQGDSLGAESVACMTKHFAGGGPQKDGEDPHFPYGKEQAYPGNNFDYHMIPFIEGAFPARTAQIMPYYGIPVGQTSEDVAFGFNKDIINGLLRDSLGFDGVVCSDWTIISDSPIGEARAWGVEHLSPLERMEKALNAGMDQFGGEYVPELIVELVAGGRIPESRIDVSVRRILRDKFRLGLFDDPYVDEQKSMEIAGNTTFREMGKRAQAKSTIILKNDQLLPLLEGSKIYAEEMTESAQILKYGEVVNSIEEADVILKRIKTPFENRTQFFMEKFFHQGRLYYDAKEMGSILQGMEEKPTIVVANLERPAILTEINEKCRVLVVDFGTSDEVLVDILFGVRKAEGLLPFELPSSQEAVENQMEDVPYDSRDPLYPFGYGLRME